MNTLAPKSARDCVENPEAYTACDLAKKGVDSQVCHSSRQIHGVTGDHHTPDCGELFGANHSMQAALVGAGSVRLVLFHITVWVVEGQSVRA